MPPKGWANREDYLLGTRIAQLDTVPSAEILAFEPGDRQTGRMERHQLIDRLRLLTRTERTAIDPAELVERLSAESDRAFIIINGSLVEDRLRFRIEQTLLRSDVPTQFVKGGETSATFDARIKLGFGLGLYTEDVRDRLDLIRHMRNAAAHSISPVDFGDETVRAATEALVLPRAKLELMTYRFWFGARCAVLGIYPDEERSWEEITKPSPLDGLKIKSAL